jgi:hypothetical protein
MIFSMQSAIFRQSRNEKTVAQWKLTNNTTCSQTARARVDVVGAR